MTVNRREFTVASALAVLSGVTIAVGGCGGESGSPTAPSAAAGDCDGDSGVPSAVAVLNSVDTVSANYGQTAISVVCTQ